MFLGLILVLMYILKSVFPSDNGKIICYLAAGRNCKKEQHNVTPLISYFVAAGLLINNGGATGFFTPSLSTSM